MTLKRNDLEAALLRTSLRTHELRADLREREAVLRGLIDEAKRKGFTPYQIHELTREPR